MTVGKLIFGQLVLMLCLHLQPHFSARLSKDCNSKDILLAMLKSGKGLKNGLLVSFFFSKELGGEKKKSRLAYSHLFRLCLFSWVAEVPTRRWACLHFFLVHTLSLDPFHTQSVSAVVTVIRGPG